VRTAFLHGIKISEITIIIDVVKKSMERDLNNKCHGNTWGKDAMGESFSSSPHCPPAKCAYI
jgi:hypothetical protein